MSGLPALAWQTAFFCRGITSSRHPPFNLTLFCEPNGNVDGTRITSTPTINEESAEPKCLTTHRLAKCGRCAVSKQTHQIAGWNHQTVPAFKIRSWLRRRVGQFVNHTSRYTHDERRVKGQVMIPIT